MIIFLCGPMGCGKSTLLHKLANSNPLPLYKNNPVHFFDLDRQIILRENMPIRDIVEQRGLAYFRLREKEVLQENLDFLTTKAALDGALIALGGGALNGETLYLIKNTPRTKIIFLKIPLELCWKRIQEDGADSRPLAAERNFKKFAELFHQREIYYHQANLSLTCKDLQGLDSFSDLVGYVNQSHN